MREVVWEVKHTTRLDGNDRPVKGWYVIHYGIACGPACETKEIATIYLAICKQETKACLRF